MRWILLIAAIAAEVAGTTSMKLSQGFTRLVPSILLAVFYLLSLTLLNLALKGIPMSVAYAVWSGAGTALVTGIGWVAFGERMSLGKTACILLIVVGVIGLNLGESHAAKADTESARPASSPLTERGDQS